MTKIILNIEKQNIKAIKKIFSQLEIDSLGDWGLVGLRRSGTDEIYYMLLCLKILSATSFRQSDPKGCQSTKGLSVKRERLSFSGRARKIPGGRPVLK